MTTLLTLEDMDSLERAMAGSGGKPVLIFKHSAT
jgi:hypothetical protein